MKKTISFFIILFTIFFSFIYSDTCNFPFPQAVNYPYGIKPNNYTQAQMNQHCLDWFNQWKNHYVHGRAQDPWMAADEYRVVRYETGDGNTEDTVSEGIGYGMIIMVYMSSATNNTKQYFDGMWKFYKRYMNGNGLMNWRIGDGGGVIGSGAATDADEDAAFALIMAHYQWGSGGAINYQQEATTLINNILNHEITANNDIKPGDGWDFGNISYFAPAYYRMFGDFTGNTRWYQVAQRTYNTIINYYKNNPDTYNSNLGLYTWLMPNWCNYDGTRNDSNDSWAMDSYSYWWDACRTPWRLTYDYLLYGTLDHQYAYECPATISNFFKTKYNGVSTQIKSHYALNGEEKTYCRKDRTPDLCDEDVMNLPPLQGAIACSAMVLGDQNWLNTCYENLISFAFPTDTGVNWGTDYFSDILKMLYLLVLSGNMKNPLGDYPTPTPTNTWNPLTPTPTFTPTPLPGIFDDFETGTLSGLDLPAGQAGFTSVVNSTERPYTGLRSCKITAQANMGWGGFGINSPYAPAGYKNYSGATTIEFDIYATSALTFFIKVIEHPSANGGDDEEWSNRNNPRSITAGTWQHISITLSTLTRDAYSPSGDNVFDLQAIQSFFFQSDNPGNNTIYIDNINFVGNFPTSTPTRTPTKTFTPVNTYTFTYTKTNTATFTQTFTSTNTDTPGGPTYTFTKTPTFTQTFTFTNTATNTPTQVQAPFGVFDDFETGVLERPDSTGDGCNPTMENSTLDKYSGQRSLRLPFSPCAPGGWGSYVSIGSPYNTAIDPEYWINFSGATSFSFWIKAPANTVFFIKVEEFESGLGGSNPDGEDWSNRNTPFTKTGNDWEKFTVNLSSLSIDPYSGRQNGNKIINTEKIEKVGFQFNGGTTGPVYIDDIIFSGMPTPTFTLTSTRTNTPTNTATNTRTQTFTNTATNTATSTFTYTATATQTNTQSPTLTNTAINTTTYTGTDTPTRTATNTYTFTITNSITQTPTFSNTFTNTPTNTGTRTATNTVSFTSTASFSNTPTPTQTVTGSQPATWTNTNTPTNSATASFTDTATNSPSSTASASPTGTATSSLSPTASASHTMTVTSSNTPSFTTTASFIPTESFTATFTITNSPSFTLTMSFTNTATAAFTYTQTVTGTQLATLTPTPTFTNSQMPTSSFTMTGTNTFTDTPTFTVTVNFTNTHTFTPVPTATETQISESEAFEIKEIKIYPIPYNCNEFLNVKFNITQECKKISIKIYTVGFRLVKNIERDGINNKGTIEIKIDNKYFKNMGNGVYYFVISGTNTEGKYIRGKPETIILLKK